MSKVKKTGSNFPSFAKLRARPRFAPSNPLAFSDLGRPVYGLAAIALGIIGLVWGDFAAVWQPVPATAPHRKALAYIVAACFQGERRFSGAGPLESAFSC